MNKPVFETFNVCDNYVLYDPIVNKFYKIPLSAYELLEKIKLLDKNERLPKTLIDKYCEGFEFLNELSASAKSFQGDAFSKPQYPYSDKQVEYMLYHRQKQLVLEMTKSCNFRCKYCILSDIYEDNDQYSLGQMPKNILKKSLDFFIKTSSDSDVLTVSFYGGEPFMCFESIKWCVEYMLKNAIGKKISFTTTTNGSLLTEEIIDYIVEHDFRMMLSLDGPKSLHDANRVFADGQATYDVVTSKLEYIKNSYPEFFERNVTFHAVVTSRQYTNEVIGYFNDSYKNRFNYSFVQPGYDEEKFLSKFSDKTSNELVQYSHRDFYQETINKIKVDPYIDDSMTYLYDKEIAEVLKIRPRENNDYFWPGGTCDIGCRRIFVDIKGKIFPCEKVTYADDTNCIGDVEKGFDIKKILELIRDYEDTSVPCQSCWCANMCKRCWKQMKIDESYCENMRRGVYDQIANSLKILFETPDIIKRYDKVDLR